MCNNYEQKLLQKIITGNYELVYIITRKIEMSDRLNGNIRLFYIDQSRVD